MEYIEREAVVELLNKWADGYSYIEVPTKDAIACVRVIPAADVAPVRHGRWIKYAPHNSDMMTCSECEKYWILDGDQYDYRYCPHCGALMDKDGDA